MAEDEVSLRRVGRGGADEDPVDAEGLVYLPAATSHGAAHMVRVNAKDTVCLPPSKAAEHHRHRLEVIERTPFQMGCVSSTRRLGPHSMKRPRSRAISPRRTSFTQLDRLRSGADGGFVLIGSAIFWKPDLVDILDDLMPHLFERAPSTRAEVDRLARPAWLPRRPPPAPISSRHR